MSYRSMMVIALCLLVFAIATKVNSASFRVPVLQPSDALPEVESSVVVRGRTSTMTVVGKSLSQTKAVEIEPATGVKVVEIKKLEARPDGLNAVSIVLTVDANAEVGQRTAALTAKDNRMDIVWFSIGTHNLTISNLKLESKRQEVIKMEEGERVIAEANYRFNFEDDAGDINSDDSPANIQTTLKCGRTSSGFYSVLTKVVMEGQNRGTVYFSIQKDQLIHARPACELQFRLKDKAGNESNRLKISLPFSGQ
ncbi:MAG: hypothetical protein JNM09_20240 [Blastocatellia bacterium]|nr:hypothetical protein [Blastocatellia bacterium]